MIRSTSRHRARGVSAASVLVGLLIAGVLGAFAYSYVHKHGGLGGSARAESIDRVPPGAVDPSVDRFRVPVGDAPVKGPGNAKVTIVEYSDFQCPFCSRAAATVTKVEHDYPHDVRVAFKHNPLPFHPNAMPAAEAASAAGEQGKFWEMHDKLFANQQQLDRPSLEKFAQELGLDVGRFKAALDADKFKKQIEADQQEALKLGSRGTPGFFINGRFLSGAQPYEAFKKVIDEEIAAADKAMKAGVAQTQVYDALTKAGKTEAKSAADRQKPRPAVVEPQLFKVPVGDAPVRGPATALVTIVEFSDFQCPFCSRVVLTLAQLEKAYPDKVRVAWKNNPLPFHNNAMLAAEAAMAAAEQGKFWEMHDTLFAHQNALERADLEKYAADLGLDAARFKKALDSHKHKPKIDADMKLANDVGARGTPCFAINGHMFRGAQPFESFKTVVDNAIVEAQKVVQAGTAPENVYAELTKAGLDKAPPPPGQPDENVVYKATLGDAPVRGAAKTAKVTIVEYSDFQCPFCGRVTPTLDQVLKAYPKDVRLAFKQLPLPFHDKAHLAAEAALAAKEQGKFWEMHDTLFKNQQALDRPALEKYAGEIGLDVGKFKAALDSGKMKEKVDAELAEGNKIGARGTPSFFINGKPFVGAQPFDNFKQKIDAELKNADEVMKKTHARPGDALYAALLKDAKTDTGAPAPKLGGDDGEDKTVYKIDPGNGPSKGPKGAPVTIVIFSDFQCPFCSKVEPTLKQVEEKYAGKVRFVWRNYPLPFHPNAMPAAEAAMAAHEQGKFWEMHDRLFAHQDALDRGTYEKYAQELGLDVGRFKAALDSGKEKPAIDADVAYANALPGGGMGTPTMFINGHKIAGAYPFEAFAKIIDAELHAKK